MDKFFSYVVWSIKYRPVKWNEVIGQMDITTILKNSIEKNRLSQILLFLGPRGIGKNTCARILANELNSFSNIFEISGFLNHSVESICETIHKIRSYPKNGKYNILIINDFHFIHQDSFNIILKILEEPPSHVLLIFCTTEKNKVYSIISRCQVYEFRHISLRDIFFYLKKIAEKERIEIDNEALYIISKNGNGSLSEALNTFEKLTFYDQKKISRELVMEKLGILDTGYYFKIIDYLLNQKISHVLILLDKIFQSGVSSINFIGGLTKHFRDLLLSKNTETLFLLKLKNKTIQFYIQQSRKICSSFLINALKICRQMEKESIIYNNSRLTIEIYLIQLANCLCTSYKESSFHKKDSDESSFHKKDSDESSFHKKDSDESSFHKKDSDVNRDIEKNVILYSKEGGMEIEDISKRHPDKIFIEEIDPFFGLQLFQVRKIGYNLGLNEEVLKYFKHFLISLYKAYLSCDALLLEINPLIQTFDHQIVAVDIKMVLDDNALFRQKKYASFRDQQEENPVEIEAFEAKLNFLKLEGNVGCMVNGAGLAMATMDMIKSCGGNPANFLDIGGSADKDRVEKAFRIILKDPSVQAILINIFGGIVRCDTVAEGIINSYHNIDHKIKIPVIVRLQGTNEMVAKKRLENSQLPIYFTSTLKEAADRIKKILMIR
ncbi:DNA polymerase III subunit delta [Blattabacterium cuenoti]|uniref:DNA polymerase III subunit delta n=1 Tax=Blattabacterium cuenoti TaxID=1653831 RepID=UPI00163C1396|nr:ATP-grasp domain-containing protein [Blattabacterium cuenoti]